MRDHHISLDVIDTDGAIRETAEAAGDAGLDRAQLLKGAAGFVAGGVVFGGLASPAQAQQVISSRRKSFRNDLRILNYALTLEHLEYEFYKEALANRPFRNDGYRLFCETTAEHERLHVDFLKKALGRNAIRKPRFDFRDTTSDPDKFSRTAQELEDTGVTAYAGQGPNLRTRALVVEALGIHSVEARHAAWIRFLNMPAEVDAEQLPAPRVFDSSQTQGQVLRAVRRTRFIRPRR
jgi:hypothetical protein